jgi:very-short-patch-repair endonuclease
MWHPLYQAVKGRYRIFCKVRLADVVYVPGLDRDERRWFRRIGAYHVDFVLCDPETTAPLLVVELDDRSHQNERQTQRDEFKDKVLAAASVPVYRVRAAEAYDPAELAANVNRMIAAAQR